MRRNAAETVVESFTLTGAVHNYRIRLKVPSSEGIAPPLRADVFVDGVAVIEDAPAGYFPSYARAFFKAWVESEALYPADRAKIENFEAARFCDDENAGCTP